MLTAGDYRRAVDISQAAQRVAPKSGSAFIQSTAQEGRLGTAPRRPRDPRRARPRRGAGLTAAGTRPARAPLPVRPAKAQFYVATTLSWLGDTAAEGIARQVLAAIEAPSYGPDPGARPWPGLTSPWR